MDIYTMMSRLSEGMLRSVIIFSLTLLFSLPLGLLVSFGRMSKWAPLKFLEGKKSEPFASKSRLVLIIFKIGVFIRNFVSNFKPLQFLMKFYISIMRGTPLMLQLLVVFFGPYYIFGINITKEYRFYAVIIAFSINYAAYFAEIYRGGIESISQGQYEAAKVLGYGKGQTFFKIILPQVIKRILPAMTNEFITLVKDTSLAFAIAYAEMFTMAKQMSASERSISPLIGAAVFYYFFNLIVAFVMEKAEKSLSYYQ